MGISHVIFERLLQGGKRTISAAKKQRMPIGHEILRRIQPYVVACKADGAMLSAASTAAVAGLLCNGNLTDTVCISKRSTVIMLQCIVF